MIFARLFRFPYVSGDSMWPTYQDGDRLVCITCFSLNDGDVVVVESDTLGGYIVKRVIGLGGQHVYSDGEHLYVDDVPRDTLFAHGSGYDEIDVVVPEGQIYVMGDNRSHSTDSRIIGCINESDIYGKVLINLGEDARNNTKVNR